jgi:tetratricopeptide (TPR) repeat protein
VARGTQHRKRRPQASARVAATPATSRRRRPKHASWEDQLFFARLRVHAKWMFVLLALVFAIGFVVFGVGSGSTGISDALQNFFSGAGGSAGPSLASLERKAYLNGNDASAWSAYAAKLVQENKLDDAIAAYRHYLGLRPRDESALEQLAGLYTRQRDHYQTVYDDSQTVTSVLSPTAPFQPSPSSPLGKAMATLTNPIQAAISSTVGSVASAAYSKMLSYEQGAVQIYRRIAQLNPKDATAQLQLGEAAAGANDLPTAIAAFSRFLALAPDDPLAPKVKQTVAQLRAAQRATATPRGKHK